MVCDGEEYSIEVSIWNLDSGCAEFESVSAKVYRKDDTLSVGQRAALKLRELADAIEVTNFNEDV